MIPERMIGPRGRRGMLSHLVEQARQAQDEEAHERALKQQRNKSLLGYQFDSRGPGPIELRPPGPRVDRTTGGTIGPRASTGGIEAPDETLLAALMDQTRRRRTARRIPFDLIG